MMTFVDKVSGKRRTVPVKFKILPASRTDWVPIILGGMSIDCVERGGLGMVTQKTGFFLMALNVCVERLDDRLTTDTYSFVLTRTIIVMWPGRYLATGYRCAEKISKR